MTVENTQKGSWQGKVVWADEKITEHFRSTLELLKLIDEAVNASAVAEQEKKEGISVV